MLEQPPQDSARATIEAHLVRTVLIIDDDLDMIARLSRTLIVARGHGDSMLQDAAVLNLREAAERIAEDAPSVCVINPGIGSTDEVLSFVERHVEPYSNVATVWVILSSAHWWNEQRATIDRHHFGERFRKYYILNRDLQDGQFATKVLAMLALCQGDLVLKLLDAATKGILSNPDAIMGPEQLHKYFAKGLAPLLRLVARSDGQDLKGNSAFVSMQLTPDTRKRYELVLQPVLREAGYQPVMIEDRPSNDIVITILRELSRCSLFICDLTGLRPDVLIEVGAALILKIPRVFIADETKFDMTELPFILKNRRVLRYVDDIGLRRSLESAIRDARSVAAESF